MQKQIQCRMTLDQQRNKFDAKAKKYKLMYKMAVDKLQDFKIKDYQRKMEISRIKGQ